MHLLHVQDRIRYDATMPIMNKQRWPLSQDCNKSNGRCKVCHAIYQLHLGDGLIHRHGPKNNPCPGSHQPPLSEFSLSQAFSSSLPHDLHTADHHGSPGTTACQSIPIVSSQSNDQHNSTTGFHHPSL